MSSLKCSEYFLIDVAAPSGAESPSAFSSKEAFLLAFLLRLVVVVVLFDK